MKDDAPIRLVAYSPDWPRLFVEERMRLEKVLKPWLHGPIEHIGSTAVPGLIAKPVIDIMAPVESLDASRDAIEVLRALDYCHFPYHPETEHWFCKPSPSLRTHQLHLVPRSSPHWTEVIIFRDRLRLDPSLASDYVALKQSLAASFRHDREAYTAGKTDFVNRATRA